MIKLLQARLAEIREQKRTRYNVGMIDSYLVAMMTMRIEAKPIEFLKTIRDRVKGPESDVMLRYTTKEWIEGYSKGLSECIDIISSKQG